MQSSYLTERLRSFGHALRGLKVLLQTQHNARIHALATIGVVIAGAFRPIPRFRGATLMFMISPVRLARSIKAC